MANFKIVVSDSKSRKAYQKEVDQNASGLVGKKIGSKVSGDFLGLQGYELEITGGSDSDGFPMRGDVEGAARKKVLLSSGTGFHPRVRGQRKRKSVRGNTISADVSQINTKVLKYGGQPIEKLLGAKKEEKKPEEKPEPKKEEQAKPAEEKKEEPAKEEQAKEKTELQKEETAEKKEEAKKAEGVPEQKTEPQKEKPKEEKKPEEKMGVKELEQTEKKEEPKKE